MTKDVKSKDKQTPKATMGAKLSLSQALDKAIAGHKQAGDKQAGDKQVGDKQIGDTHQARFSIGDGVRHRLYGFYGMIFDVDPEFANSEDWYNSIPKALRPRKDQPFYHLLAVSKDEEEPYIAYVSEQNLEKYDIGRTGVNHPALTKLFKEENGRWIPHNRLN